MLEYASENLMTPDDENPLLLPRSAKSRGYQFNLYLIELIGINSEAIHIVIESQ
jgi:hypothetical protein